MPVVQPSEADLAPGALLSQRRQPWDCLCAEKRILRHRRRAPRPAHLTVAFSQGVQALAQRITECLLLRFVTFLARRRCHGEQTCRRNGPGRHCQLVRDRLASQTCWCRGRSELNYAYHFTETTQTNRCATVPHLPNRRIALIYNTYSLPIVSEINLPRFFAHLFLNGQSVVGRASGYSTEGSKQEAGIAFNKLQIR